MHHADIFNAVMCPGLWVKSGSAEVWNAGVLKGKKQEILRDVSHIFTRLQRNRGNTCNGYNVGCGSLP